MSVDGKPDHNHNDLYEQLGRVVNAVDNIKENFNTRVVELRADIKEVRLDVANVAQVCSAHNQRLMEVEHRLGVGKPPTGTGYAKVPEAELKAAAEKAIDAYADDATDRIKLDVIQAAQQATLDTLKKQEKDRAEQKQQDEELKDRRTRRFQQYLQIAATCLALLGGGSVAAALRFMYNAQQAVTSQTQTLNRIQTQVGQRLPPPDAAVR